MRSRHLAGAIMGHVLKAAFCGPLADDEKEVGEKEIKEQHCGGSKLLFVVNKCFIFSCCDGNFYKLA